MARLRGRRRAPCWALWLALVTVAAGAGAAEGGTPAERGAYLAKAGGCVVCHTHEDAGGELLAGGRAFETPFGTFYAPNITPDPGRGIGAWSKADFVRALTEGRAPQGRVYFPVFPYTAYTHLRPQDVDDLWAYLQTVPPRSTAVPSHRTDWYLRLPLAMRVWRWVNFDAGPLAPAPQRSEPWRRGRYLAEALAHCAECHTPRDWMGGLREDRRYGGSDPGPDGEAAPNITPHREAGIGRWSVDDLSFYLEIGMTPGGDFTGGSMAKVVDGVTAPMTPADRKALATYILSLRPVGPAPGAQSNGGGD